MLNELFSRNFIPRLSESDGQSFSADLSSPSEALHEEEVFNFLIALDTTSGPDGISGKMFKATAGSTGIAPVLSELFDLSITSGSIPQKWKLSSVVLIPKSSNIADNPLKYRPISQWSETLG